MSTAGGNLAMTVPPIPRTRPEEAKNSAGETLKFKLLSDLSKKTTPPTYEMVVNQFRTGTQEEYIKAVIVIDQVCNGQGIDKDPTQNYVMVHQILMGEALTSFNKAAADVCSKNDMSDKGTETLDNYEKVILKVAAAAFPIRAYVTQKQAMHCSMRKPMDMKICDYVDRLLKINSYLKYFPTNTGERITVMPKEEIMDILTYGIPNT
jgi:hypothetical protein